MVGEDAPKPISPEEKRAERLRVFRSLLDDFSSEDPAHPQGWSTGNYKVRGTWFSAMQLNVDMSLRDGLIKDENFEKEAEDFFEAFAARRHNRKGVMGTVEEVNAGDALIKKAIKLIEEQQP